MQVVTTNKRTSEQQLGLAKKGFRFDIVRCTTLGDALHSLIGFDFVSAPRMLPLD